MKKAMVLLSCLIIASMCMLAGCGGSGSADKYADSPYVGTWVGTTASYAGIELGVSDILGGDFTITLEANGTATVDVAGDSESGSWEPTDNGMKLVDSSDELEFIDNEGVLVIDYDGVSMNFEKQ